MDLGSLIALLKLAQDAEMAPTKTTVSDYQIGDYCPTQGKRLTINQTCVNNRIQPRLE
jgi:hypothetical protein